MSSHLVPMHSEIFDQWVRDAEAVSQIFRVRMGSPWAGLTPDLDPNIAPPSAMDSGSYGLIAKPGPGGIGEVLTQDEGFEQIDGDNLPLTTTTGSHTNITMLGNFNRTSSVGAKASGTEYDGQTLLALVGGDNLTAGAAELWRLLPTAGTWEQVPYSGGAAAAGHEATVGREFLSDWAEFPAGAPNRTADNGAIAEPVFVWCNLTDRVMVYPVDDTVVAGIEDGAYEPLTDQFGDDFRAGTVEHFGGRLYFGNTMESGTQYRQRIRRTALFTADPLATNPGAGAFDIRDFSGDLLRLEKLGDLMVAYFEDGTAFIRLSDVATAPDRVQLLREKRGLLGTHAVCSVGAQEHFGIFDDGWFFLDPSGRWTEAGMTTVDGKQIPLWKDTFYRTLDDDYRHRVVVDYDGQFVRIVFTAVGDTDNEEVWIYDPRGNRVFRDFYPVTVWGSANLTVQAATGWDDLTETWSAISGTWESYAAKFGIKQTVHGATTGHVLQHKSDLISRYNVKNSTTQNPYYSYQGLTVSGGNPTRLKTMNRVWVEYLDTGEDEFTVTVGRGTQGGGRGGRLKSGTISSKDGATAGDIETGFQDYNFTAVNLSVSVSGQAPSQIRSISADVETGESEERFS